MYVYIYIYIYVSVYCNDNNFVSRIYRYDWCIRLHYRVIYLYFHTFVIRIIALALLLLSFV